jgi:dienelactone hydrolase
VKGLAVVLVPFLLVAGCSPDASDHATIESDHAAVLADQSVHLKVSGLKAHETVTVETGAVDVQGMRWHAEATFDADDRGVVDVDQASPSSGSYKGRDGMGLFWSMNPAEGDPELQSFNPPTKDHRPTAEVQVSVRADKKTLANATVTRQWLGEGVTTKTLTMAADGVSGLLFLPPPDDAKHPAVLVFGGSEGGLGGGLSTASLLASHGYPTLAVAYFHAAGLPAGLKNIPLEYFATAARLLAKQPGVDPEHLIALSASRGTEAALLLAQNFPQLVRGAVLYSPSAKINGSFPVPGAAAWTLRGKPLEPDQLIPVDHVNGPVLAIAGTDDQLWQSWTAAPLITHELDEAHNPYPHQALVFQQAGHAIAGAPYTPHGTSMLHPVIQRPLALGGTRPANEAALLQGWTKTLDLLETL